jgi:hypothetical protein
MAVAAGIVSDPAAPFGGSGFRREAIEEPRATRYFAIATG